MAGGFSIHAVDISCGEPATGLLVELRLDGNDTILSGRITNAGTPDCAEALLSPKANGRYTVTFHVAEYFREIGAELPYFPFLDIARYDFQYHDPGKHIHLPFKFSPWGFSLFLGN